MRQLSDRRVNNRYKIGRYPETVQTSCPYIIAHQDPFVKYLFNKYFHFHKNIFEHFGQRRYYRSKNGRSVGVSRAVFGVLFCKKRNASRNYEHYPEKYANK